MNTVLRGDSRASSAHAEMSPQVYARIAGVLYLIIAVVAGIAHFYVPSTLIVPGDSAATSANILANEILLRYGGIGGELVILLSEVVLTVLLYVLFARVNKTVSLLAAVSRLIMTTIHGMNLIHYGFALILLSGADYLTVFAPEQLNSLALFFLNAHEYGFTIGIAFLTLHAFALGSLILRSRYVPVVLGALFIVAALGYLIDSTAGLLVVDYATPDLLAMVIALSEVVFPLWLLVRGVRMDVWQARAA